jgi:hypothetical protein
MDSGEDDPRGSSSLSGIDVLEQCFSQLPPDGKTHIKDYLQSLVSMQNTMAGADNTHRCNKGQ